MMKANCSRDEEIVPNEHNNAKYVSEKYVTKLLIPRKLINVQRSLFIKR